MDAHRAQIAAIGGEAQMLAQRDIACAIDRGAGDAVVDAIGGDGGFGDGYARQAVAGGEQRPGERGAIGTRFGPSGDDDRERLRAIGIDVERPFGQHRALAPQRADEAIARGVADDEGQGVDPRRRIAQADAAQRRFDRDGAFGGKARRDDGGAAIVGDEQQQRARIALSPAIEPCRPSVDAKRLARAIEDAAVGERSAGGVEAAGKRGEGGGRQFGERDPRGARRIGERRRA
jgi:hypothetical protein